VKAEIEQALARPSLVDITTTGRRSGRPHRIELVFFNFDGRIYISGMPGPRDWYANLLADPRLTFHLKGGPLKAGPRADLPARARPIEDDDERRAIFARIAAMWGSDPERLIRESPLVEVIFPQD
jgi:deazaflavin-dependent oxidoreductase (nitroreductase family)